MWDLGILRARSCQQQSPKHQLQAKSGGLPRSENSGGDLHFFLTLQLSVTFSSGSAGFERGTPWAHTALPQPWHSLRRMSGILFMLRVQYKKLLCVVQSEDDDEL